MNVSWCPGCSLSACSAPPPGLRMASSWAAAALLASRLLVPVAVVLRGTGNEVRLVVARPVDPNDPAQHRPSLPILPSAIINNRQELEMHLNMGVIPDGIPSSQLANDMILNPGTENVSIQRGGQAVAEEMSTRFDQV